MSRRLARWMAVLWLLGAGPAVAHGPAVELSLDRVSPAAITIGAGQWVHFKNTSVTPRTMTVRAADGSFESPAMGRGEGWHHTFEDVGTHSYGVMEFPSMTGEVTVVPATSE